MKYNKITLAEPYQYPRAEVLPFITGQPFLDSSAQLDDGSDDDEWGDDNY